MPYLNLYGNKIGESGVESLVTCIHHIEKLCLEHCQIGPDGVKTLALKIQTLNEKVKFYLVFAFFLFILEIRYCEEALKTKCFYNTG